MNRNARPVALLPLTILSFMDQIGFYHFNDVYHVNQSTVLSRFAYDLKQKGNAITVFSGDALGPSLESSMLKGEHIIPILNHLDIDIACYGNHDFDFGEDRLNELSALCNFPFVLSNAFHPSGKLLAAAKEYVVREHLGYRIGFFGLAGTDWPSNCQHLPQGTIFGDPVETAARVSKILRETEKVDLVVAVTHMRLEEDFLVSEECPLVDFILGGHDHDIVVHGEKVTVVNDDAMGRIRIVKSGTDFRSYSVVRVPIRRVEGNKVELGTIQVHHKRDLSLASQHPEDPNIPVLIASLQEHIASISNKPLFHAGCPLDGRGTVIRTSETNLGNLLADVVRAYYNTDIAFVNSGSIRCDRIVPEGVLTMRDVVEIVPFGNILVVKRVTARTLLRALENSVSDSRTDGRFLQLSGMSIEVDFGRAEGSRILRLTVGETNIVPSDSFDHLFTVAMGNFIADGFDGYTCFTEPEVETIVSVEGAMTDTGIMLEILEEPPQELDADHISRSRKAVFADAGRGLPLLKPEIQGRIVVVSK